MAIHSISSLKEIFFDTLETGKYKTGCIVTRKTLNLHFDDWIQQIYFYLSFRFESTKAV